MVVSGEGEEVEVDGCYVGGYVKPANHKKNRRDRRLAENPSGKRCVVVAIRERDRRTVTNVFQNEADAATLTILRPPSSLTRAPPLLA